MAHNLNKELHAVLNQYGAMEQKASLVNQFTNGRTTSSRDMSQAECLALIKALKGETPKTVEKPSPKSKSNDKANRMRRKIIAMMVHGLGWTYNDIDAFCKKSGHIKKDKLNDYDSKELVKLVGQFELVHKDQQAKLHDATRNVRQQPDDDGAR